MQAASWQSIRRVHKIAYYCLLTAEAIIYIPQSTQLFSEEYDAYSIDRLRFQQEKLKGKE
jgi:hypothetical protein